jgi:uncharacterized protein YjbJ (UPF0337 family)
MTEGTKDQIAGALHELKGHAKQKVGEIIGNPTLEGEGQGENLAGTVQKKIGQVEAVLEK